MNTAQKFAYIRTELNKPEAENYTQLQQKIKQTFEGNFMKFIAQNDIEYPAWLRKFMSNLPPTKEELRQQIIEKFPEQINRVYQVIKNHTQKNLNKKL